MNEVSDEAGIEGVCNATLMLLLSDLKYKQYLFVGQEKSVERGSRGQEDV